MALFAFNPFLNTLCSKATELLKTILTFTQLTDLKLNEKILYQ